MTYDNENFFKKCLTFNVDYPKVDIARPLTT